MTIVNMKARLKNILTGLKNLWKWRKVIYKDRDWDHWYIFEILKTKLKYQAEHLQKHGMTMSAGVHTRQMLECVELIDKVQNETYIEEALEGLGEHDWTDEAYNDCINKHNEAKKRLFHLLENKIELWWD
jgi:hypothetical protein